MDADFWIKAWEEGRTRFNQNDFHPKLLEFFPRFNPRPGQRVLVPLCGKSVDLMWLQSLGIKVHGVELYEKAVTEFFSENNLQVEIEDRPPFKVYTHEKVAISCGDYFRLSEENAYDFVYDRAALVALPESMRKEYVRVTARALKPGGRYLLVVYEYEQKEFEGPPFSVSEKEVRALYGEEFWIELVDTSDTELFPQKVYILEKKGP